MGEVVPVVLSPERRQRALEIVERLRSQAAGKANNIAATTAAAVRESIEAVAPYTSQGGSLDAELEIRHRDADGSETFARVKFKYGRGA